MAIMGSRAFAILALVAACFDMFAMPLGVQAEDPPAEAAAEAADAAPAATGEGEGEGAGEGEGEGESEGEKGQQFVDSARELQEKLGQLKALLDAKGEGADPGLKDKLAGLENQLKDLGLDTLTGGSGAASPELTEFLGACVAMSMRRAGMQRPATLGALRKLVDGKLPPAEAAKNELWRMVGVCVGDFREDEFADFKAGRMKILPKAYVDESKKPEAEKKVLEIDAQVWEELRKISAGLLKELAGPEGPPPPINFAYLAFIPVGLAVAFMTKLFFDMQARNEEKAGKKKDKKDKKGQ